MHSFLFILLELSSYDKGYAIGKATALPLVLIIILIIVMRKRKKKNALKKKDDVLDN